MIMQTEAEGHKHSARKGEIDLIVGVVCICDIKKEQ